MAAAANRVIYVGTTEDAYELLGRGRRHYASRSLGLRGRGAVRGFVVDQSDPRRLHVGTSRQGILRSTDGGGRWTETNTGFIYKNVFSLTQHPLTGDLYAGTEPANVFQSADGGDNWSDFPALPALPESRDWTFPRPPHIAHVRDIALRTDDPSDLFCAIEDGWLVRSRDGGRTWRQVRHGVHADAHSVAFMPDDPSIVYVATGNFGYRSTDGGETFVEARHGMDRGYMAGIVVHPKRPEVLLTMAAKHPPPQWRRAGDGADAAVYRSDDQGLSWQRVTAGLQELERAGSWSMAGDPDDPDVAFIGLFDGRVLATDDGGESFHEIAHLEGSVRSMTVRSSA